SKTLTGDQTNMDWQYSYNSNTKQLEQLTLTNADGNNAVYTYSYDSYKRPAIVKEDNLHAVFTRSFSYDSFGRLLMLSLTAKDKASSRTAFRVLQHHYQNGELLKMVDWLSGQRIYEINGLNARGQATSALMGS